MTRCHHGADEDYCARCAAEDVDTALAQQHPPEPARHALESYRAIGRRGVAAARRALADKPTQPEGEPPA